MTEHMYRIAGQTVCLRQDWEEPYALFSAFALGGACEPDFTVELYWGARPGRAWYGLSYQARKPEESRHIFTSRQFPAVRLEASENWSVARIEDCQNAHDGVMEVFLAAFYSFLSRRGGLLVHASLVKYRGESVLFTAASGVGKTTQAELWRNYMGAEILNGDKAVLTAENEGFTAWGTPWCGSSPYASAASAPLKAIVVLEQAKENRIERLGTMQAVTQFFPNVFFPSWDRSCTESVAASLDAVLRSVPIYLLSCRPDEEAVVCTQAAIWGEEKL